MAHDKDSGVDATAEPSSGWMAGEPSPQTNSYFPKASLFTT